VKDGYAADAADLILRWEAISYDEVFAPVADLLPARPCRVLDAGAGTGRGAAWFADRGHEVVAVEPVRELREAGAKLHPSPNIAWVEDRLPELNRVRASGGRFDLLVLVGVWQHLRFEERCAAVETLGGLAAPGARLVMSLRHGPGSPARPCFPCDPDETIAGAAGAGLALVARRAAQSVQQANRDLGVTWTWLAFDKDPDSIH
jgi:SAM-dependent methyltransferase